MIIRTKEKHSKTDPGPDPDPDPRTPVFGIKTDIGRESVLVSGGHPVYLEDSKIGRPYAESD